MKNRVRWLDTSKGAGIFLVVLGHCLISPMRESVASCHFLYELIYAVHMPFFAFLSGCSFSLAQERYLQEKPSVFLKKKAKSFLLPYFAYNLAVYLIFTLFNQLSSLRGILSEAGYGPLSPARWLFGLFTGGNSYAYHTWYLYALFFYFVFAYFILRLFPENKKRQIICGLSVSAILLCLHFFSPLGAWMGMRDLTYFALWFFLGWQIRKPSMPRPAFVCGLFLPLIFFLANYRNPAFPSSQLLLHSGKLLLRLMAVLSLVRLMPAVKGKLEQALHFLGTRSFEIYLFHQPFIGTCLGSVCYLLLGLPAWLTVLLTMFLSILLPLGAAAVLRKNSFLRFLFSLQNRRPS